MCIPESDTANGRSTDMCENDIGIGPACRPSKAFRFDRSLRLPIHMQ